MRMTGGAGSPAELRVGGFTPCSTDVLPGRRTAVIFVQGCPWRCGYCQNPHLQLQRPSGPLSWSRLKPLIEANAARLDAVLFSGGEPILDPALPSALREVRALGLQAGMHTAGIDPERLQEVLPLLHWVTLDIKAPFAGYERITGTPGSGQVARKAAQIILASGVPYEFRTTFHPALLEEADIATLAHELAALRSQSLTLQRFRPQGCRSRTLRRTAETNAPSAALLASLRDMFPRFSFTT